MHKEIVEKGCDQLVNEKVVTSARRDAFQNAGNKYQQALTLIYMCLNESIFEKVPVVTIVWGVLQHSFGGKNKVIKGRLQIMRIEYENLKMDTEFVEEYFNRILATVNQLWRYDKIQKKFR